MQYSLICISLLLFLSCEATTHSLDSVIGCYSIDNDGTKLNFYCSNAEKSFNLTCVTTTLSEAMQKLNASAVIELKMCGCAIDTLVDVKKKLENVRFLDISHSNYKSKSLFNESIVDVLFDQKLVKLNATHNHLTRLPNKLFYKMPNVTMIDVSHNHLFTFSWEAFKGASKLEEIHMQHNLIMPFNGEDIPEINKVKYLDLRDNPLGLKCNILSLLYNNDQTQIYISWQFISILDLTCIESKFMVRFNEYESITFRNGIVELHCNQFSLRNIREIWANTNQMKNVYKIVSIVGLTLESLEELDISGSDLMEFDFRILSKMKQLTRLDISNCNLKKVINPSVLQSISIRRFDASGNQIQNAHEIIEHLNPSIRELYLSGSFIGKLISTAITKLKDLTILKLSNTNLQMVDSHLFDQLESLIILDISNNNLNKMNFTISFPSSLERLFVAGCQIENVLDVIQFHGTKVSQLDLSGNFVGTLNSTTFDQLTSLKFLYLKNTSLSFSDLNPFHKLDRVVRLDVSNNNLKNVNFTILSSTLNKLWEFKAADCNIENAFDVIKLLGPIGIIDLSGNFVGRIDAFTFHKMIWLRELYLRNTSLSIDDGSNPFEPLNILNVLDISRNNLSNVNWTIFSPTLARLDHLSVAECQIANPLDLIKLLGSFSIKHLDLSGNIVREVNASTFERFKRLNDLHLSNTSLFNFDFNTLEHAKKLNLLDISYNRFKKLNVSLKLDYLQTLDLRGCELAEIHNFDKINLPNLKVLGISKNRLSCEYLERLKNEWPSLEFIDNDLSQTDQPNCQKSIETTTDISAEVLGPFKFRAPHIVSMIASVVFFIAILFLLFRYILCEKRCDNYLQNNDNEMVVLPRVDGVGAANNDAEEHIYEEIVEQIDPYDHLNFDPTPSSALQQHYENAPEPIDELEIVSNASESIESCEEIDDSILI